MVRNRIAKQQSRRLVLPLSMVDNSHSALQCGKMKRWAGDGVRRPVRRFFAAPPFGFIVPSFTQSRFMAL